MSRLFNPDDEPSRPRPPARSSVADWMVYFACHFTATFVAVVLAGVLLGVLARGYVHWSVAEAKAELLRDLNKR